MFIILACSLFVNSAFAAVSVKQVESVYTKLIQANNLKNVQLYIVKSPEINAMNVNQGEGIVVYTGMMKFIKNNDELAMVLGHELGHNLWHSEARADEYGAKYAIKAGFNYCKGALLFKSKEFKYGDYPIHPPGAERWKAMNCGE